jgi:O-antigen/teichoic acid export membrane protein
MPSPSLSATRSVARNTFYLSLAQGIRMLVGFALILAIANGFGVGWQGKFSILLAFLNVFQVLASLGLPRLITREVARQPEESNRYFWAGLLGQGMGAVVMALVMVAVVAVMPYPADTRAMLTLAIVALPVFTVYSVAAALLRAREQMHYLVYAEGLSAVAQIALAVLVLLRWQSVMALALIRVGGLVMAAGLVVIAARRLDLWGKPWLDGRFAGHLLRRSASFFGMAGLDALLQRMDVLILSVVAGEAAAGLYDAAFQLIKVIMTLVMAFTDALYPVLSRLFVQARARFSLAVGKALHYGLVVLLPTAAGMSVLAPQLIDLLYRRPEYAVAAPVLAVAAWAMVAYFLQMVLTRTLLAGNRARGALAATMLMIAVGAPAIAAGSRWFGAAGAAAGLGVMYGVGSLLAWRASRDWEPAFGFLSLARSALAAGLMAAFLAFMPTWPLALLVPLGAGLYLVLALMLGALARQDLHLWRLLWGHR